MRVDADTGLTAIQRSILAWKRRLRSRTTVDLSVPLDEGDLLFRCRSAIEENRAANLLNKEPGTIRWLRESLSPGDVFVDVGANVGIYSLLAARLIGSGGKVYAFEPHAANFESLMFNIENNSVQDCCTPLSCALSNVSGFQPFYYASLTPGSSMSQLDNKTDPAVSEVSSGLAEMKYAVALDDLIDQGVMKRPTHIKIDVDGVESKVVQGMSRLLTNDPRPVSVQIEVQPDTQASVLGQMEAYDYSVSHRHHTLSLIHI